MFSDKETLRCGFETYHLYRWGNVPSYARKLSTVFHEGILQECRKDHFAVDTLRAIVKRTLSNYPTLTTYGDDPEDQRWIARGKEYFHNRGGRRK